MVTAPSSLRWLFDRSVCSYPFVLKHHPHEQYFGDFFAGFWDMFICLTTANFPDVMFPMYFQVRRPPHFCAHVPRLAPPPLTISFCNNALPCTARKEQWMGTLLPHLRGGGDDPGYEPGDRCRVHRLPGKPRQGSPHQLQVRWVRARA